MDHAIKNAVHSDQRATISYMTHLLTLEARRVGREPAAFTFCQKAPWPMKAPQLPTFMLVLLDLLTNRQGLDRSNVANDLVQLLELHPRTLVQPRLDRLVHLVKIHLANTLRDLEAVLLDQAIQRVHCFGCLGIRACKLQIGESLAPRLFKHLLLLHKCRSLGCVRLEFLHRLVKDWLCVGHGRRQGGKNGECCSTGEQSTAAGGN
mmetsp:Transcript_49265/g.128537  ORF Transcript_49265/g.128537 Transcript_49265/m.128537 type:complete len:206 (-) Transcript_49265:85-702(-)